MSTPTPPRRPAWERAATAYSHDLDDRLISDGEIRRWSQAAAAALPRSSRPGPLIVTGDGRSTALLRWLAQGRYVRAQAPFSRAILTPTHRQAEYLIDKAREMPEVHAALDRSVLVDQPRYSTLSAFRSVIFTPHDGSKLRGFDRDYAVDDLDGHQVSLHRLQMASAGRVLVVSLPGTVVDAADAFA